MNWYRYWYYANAFLFDRLFGWLKRNNKGLALYLLISFSPLIALYALPFMVLEKYMGMTTVYNEYLYWTLLFGVPVIHLFVFYPGSKRHARWENEYRKRCTDGKNLAAVLFSLCCLVAGGVLLFG